MINKPHLRVTLITFHKNILNLSIFIESFVDENHVLYFFYCFIYKGNHSKKKRTNFRRAI